MNLNEFIKTSSESELLSFNFSEQGVSISLFHDSLNKNFNIKINTNNVFSNLTSLRQTTCYLEISLIEKYLEVKNGVFMPNQNFGIYMDEIRHGFHIAYGLRSSKYKFFLVFNGDFRIVMPIENYSDISIQDLSLS
jgi:hypothetical protein